jgi:hypothetical protein
MMADSPSFDADLIAIDASGNVAALLDARPTHRGRSER